MSLSLCCLLCFSDIKTSSNPPKTKIFVGRLPENAQAADLRRLFEQYGTVTECDILNRYGFVHMKTEDQASRAIENLHNCNFQGSTISVEASTGKRSNREGGGPAGPRRGGGAFGARGGRGGFGPMRGGMGYGGMRSSPYDRPGPYGRPDSYGRPEPGPYGRPDFDRRPVGPGPVGPGPVPAGPGPAPPAGAGMGAMRNGYYDDRRDAGAYMDRSADYMERRDGRDAAYGMDRMGMARMDGYDRAYGDYAARAAPMPTSDMYAATYREGDRSAYPDMRQSYERRDMTPREMPAARDAYDRAAMPPQSYERRDYGAARMGAATDMFSRRTPPPPQPAYTAG
ncbi:hypothetical protein ONE63_006257 [Megalurothrips usitatus]|uniref:RRM domain-containing protein n=1 Tax=Megalurothrips usitatus TaxID=439358 RepID=A0AAV7XX04_9NEOP|nr:hypothetical protein ONE63_006257 [Megalurothrips usitatus]